MPPGPAGPGVPPPGVPGEPPRQPFNDGSASRLDLKDRPIRVDARGGMEISRDGRFLFCDRGLIVTLGQ
jgi:hypothetical protein